MKTEEKPPELSFGAKLGLLLGVCIVLVLFIPIAFWLFPSSTVPGDLPRGGTVTLPKTSQDGGEKPPLPPPPPAPPLRRQAQLMQQAELTLEIDTTNRDKIPNVFKVYGDFDFEAPTPGLHESLYVCNIPFNKRGNLVLEFQHPAIRDVSFISMGPDARAGKEVKDGGYTLKFKDLTGLFFLAVRTTSPEPVKVQHHFE